MAYIPHDVIEPEKFAASGVELMVRELVVPTLFARKSVDDFKGAKDDTLNMTVPGVLPAHSYGWRNDRTDEMQVDQYKERKIAIKFGGDAYSATALTDEQYEFDLIGWLKLIAAQTKGVARWLEYEAIDTLKNADYSVLLGAKAENILNDVIEARRVLNRMGAPKVGRTLLVGSDFDTILQANDRVNKAMNVGDSAAQSAIQDATIGKLKGFTIVTSEDLEPDEAYALTGSGFAFLNAAPHVPDSVTGATTTSEGGYSMRWLKDYEALRTQERSVVNTWYGFQQVKDAVVYRKAGAKEDVVSADEYMLRAVKLKLGGTDSYFASGSDKAAVSAALGLTARSAATTYVPPSGGVSGS